MYKLIVVCYRKDGSKITYTNQYYYVEACFTRIYAISKEFSSVHYEIYKRNRYKYELQEKGQFNERS